MLKNFDADVRKILRVIHAVALFGCLAAGALFAATARADQFRADECLLADCPESKIHNQCDKPVNFAHCHFADQGGCLLKFIKRIEAGEALDFICERGKLPKIGGCFPPFMPVSMSGAGHVCAPDPEDAGALAASAGRNAPIPPSAASPQAPNPSPAPEVAQNPSPEEPAESEAEIRARQQEAEAAMQRARELALQASEANELSLESAAEIRRLRAEYQGGGGLLEATGKALHALAIVGAAYLASKGKTQEAKSMLEAILKIKGQIDENTRQRAETLLAQIEETEAQQQQQQEDAEALAVRSMEALRGAPSPTGTATEKLLRKCQAWDGQLKTGGIVEFKGDEQVDSDGDICSRKCDATHLHWAAQLYDLTAMRWLLANGADVHAGNGCNDGTPLHWTAVYSSDNYALDAELQNRRAAIELLIESGADVNRGKDDGGSTPVDWAISNDITESRAILESLGGRCNTRC